MIPFAIATDFMGSTGDPSEPLRLIAEAGFKQIHWCHQWTGVHVYPREEIDAICELVASLDLCVNDLHATDGGVQQGFPWMSQDKAKHEMGIDLIYNRMAMANRLKARTIVLHAPVAPIRHDGRFWSLLWSNLDQIETWARSFNVRVAFENTDGFPSNIPTLWKILDRTRPPWFGVCLDTGHANIHGVEGANFVRDLRVRKRLYAVHINDNMGPDVQGDPDTHMLPFDGNIDWEEMIRYIGNSSYNGSVSLEVGRSQYAGLSSEKYLAIAYERGMRLANMHAAVRATRF